MTPLERITALSPEDQETLIDILEMLDEEDLRKACKTHMESGRTLIRMQDTLEQFHDPKQ